MDTRIIGADEQLAQELPRATNWLLEIADKSKDLAKRFDSVRDYGPSGQLQDILQKLVVDAAIMQNVMVVLLRQTMSWSKVKIRFADRRFAHWTTADGMAAIETMQARDRDILQGLCAMLVAHIVGVSRALEGHRKKYGDTVLTNRLNTSMLRYQIAAKVQKGIEAIHRDVSAISQLVTWHSQAEELQRLWEPTRTLDLPQALDLEVRRDSGIPGADTASASTFGLRRRSSISSESDRTETYEEEGTLSYVNLSILSVDGLILKEQQIVLLDSGATDAAMSGQLATELRLRTEKLKVPVAIQTASRGDLIPVTDQVLIKVLWKDKDGMTKRVKMLLYVAWSLDEEMHLSNGFINKYQLQDIAEKVHPGMVQFKKNWFTWSSKKQRKALDNAWEKQAEENQARNSAEDQVLDAILAKAVATRLNVQSTRP